MAVDDVFGQFAHDLGTRLVACVYAAACINPVLAYLAGSAAGWTAAFGPMMRALTVVRLCELQAAGLALTVPDGALPPGVQHNLALAAPFITRPGQRWPPE